MKCVLSEHVRDLMGFQDYSQEVMVLEQQANAICTLWTFNIPDDTEPWMLDAIDEIAGIGLMRRLPRVFEPHGVPQDFGRAQHLSDTTLYVCFDDGRLQLQLAAVQEGVPSINEGRSVGDGFTMFRKVIPNGEFALYGLKPTDRCIGIGTRGTTRLSSTGKARSGNGPLTGIWIYSEAAMACSTR